MHLRKLEYGFVFKGMNRKIPFFEKKILTSSITYVARDKYYETF